MVRLPRAPWGLLRRRDASGDGRRRISGTCSKHHSIPSSGARLLIRTAAASTFSVAVGGIEWIDVNAATAISTRLAVATRDRIKTDFILLTSIGATTELSSLLGSLRMTPSGAYPMPALARYGTAYARKTVSPGSAHIDLSSTALGSLFKTS